MPGLVRDSFLLSRHAVAHTGRGQVFLRCQSSSLVILMVHACRS